MAKKKKEENFIEAAEKEAEFFLKVEAGEIEPDEAYLKKLHWDELIEIKDLLDPEKEENLYQKVEKALYNYLEPKIEIAQIGERVWSFFYEKYFLRILLFLWAFLAYFIYQKNVLLTEKMGTKAYWIIFAIGAFILIFIGRIYLAYAESRKNNTLSGSKIRQKLGIVVVQKNGYPPSFLKSFARGLFKSFPLIFLTLLSLELDKKNRGIHDRLFGTYVLRINDKNVTRKEIADFIEKNFSN